MHTFENVYIWCVREPLGPFSFKHRPLDFFLVIPEVKFSKYFATPSQELRKWSYFNRINSEERFYLMHLTASEAIPLHSYYSVLEYKLIEKGTF